MTTTSAFQKYSHLKCIQGLRRQKFIFSISSFIRISKVFSFHFHHPVHTLKNSCVNSKVAFLIIKWLEFSEVWRPPTRLITYFLRYTAPRIIHRVALFLLHPKVLLRSVEKSSFFSNLYYNSFHLIKNEDTTKGLKHALNPSISKFDLIILINDLDNTIYCLELKHCKYELILI